jgi:hypothetical protein
MIFTVKAGTVSLPPHGPGLGGQQATYLGCFRDQGDPQGLAYRDINGFVMNLDAMTTERCTTECRTRGFPYAGTQYGRWCFCGDSYGRGGAADNCYMACSGNSRQICGGAWANNVYVVGGSAAQPQPSTRTFASPSLGQYRLNWCREYGANSGDPAAQAFCQAADFSRSRTFQGPDKAANLSQTIGSNQLCQGEGCGGFYSTTCQ